LLPRYAYTVLVEALKKYPAVLSPPPSSVPTPHQQSEFMFPHERRRVNGVERRDFAHHSTADSEGLPARRMQRSDTVDTLDTMASEATCDTHLTDSDAVRYRTFGKGKVVRVYRDGYWGWARVGAEGEKPREGRRERGESVLGLEEPEDGEEGGYVRRGRWWTWWGGEAR
jgi:hypothetical protein